MGMRSGDLDPGLAWYLARTERMSAKQFNEMVTLQSGLLGISETSSDVHDLLERDVHDVHDVRAADAVALFCYELEKRIDSSAAALGGLDTLVFAGDIGENAPLVRARICDGLGSLGITLDTPRNTESVGVISTDARLQSLMFLKLSIAGHLTISLTRTRGPFWPIRPAKPLWIAVLGTQIVATLIAVYGLLMMPIGWSLALIVWGYALVWALVNDRVKLLAYRVLDRAKSPSSGAAGPSNKPRSAAALKPDAAGMRTATQRLGRK